MTTTSIEAAFVIPAKTLAVVGSKTLLTENDVSTVYLLGTDRAQASSGHELHVLKVLER